MNHKLVVANCLALYGHYTGVITQADKDFIDARVAQAIDNAEDAFLAVLLLLTMRLSLELPEERAAVKAQELTEEHAGLLAQFLPPINA